MFKRKPFLSTACPSFYPSATSTFLSRFLSSLYLCCILSHVSSSSSSSSHSMFQRNLSLSKIVPSIYPPVPAILLRRGSLPLSLTPALPSLPSWAWWWCTESVRCVLSRQVLLDTPFKPQAISLPPFLPLLPYDLPLIPLIYPTYPPGPLYHSLFLNHWRSAPLITLLFNILPFPVATTTPQALYFYFPSVSFFSFPSVSSSSSFVYVSLLFIFITFSFHLFIILLILFFIILRF